MVISSKPRIRHNGSSFPSGFQPVDAMIGKAAILASSSTMCNVLCVLCFNMRLDASEYAYPPSNAT